MKKLQNPGRKNYECAHIKTAFRSGNDRFHKANGIRFINSNGKMRFVCFFGKESDKSCDCKGRNDLCRKKKEAGFYVPENGDSNSAYQERRSGIDAVAKHF